MMLQLAAIALGGAAGAVARFSLSNGVYAWLGRDFPYGTLAVNVIGSLLMGLLYVLMVERMASSPEARAALLIGFLGAFTTFSTFSLETLNLLEAGYVFKAVLNMLLSVVLCVLATWAGFLIARIL